MRKILLFLSFIPLILAIAHDTYLYAKAPEKGLFLSDIGWLWDKYHKESHDQWKKQIGTIEQKLNDEIKNIEKTAQETFKTHSSKNETDEEKKEFEKSFTQINKIGKDPVYLDGVSADSSELSVQKQGVFSKIIGFILQQKAILIFGILALLAFLLDRQLEKSAQKRQQKDDLGFLSKKKKSKNGEYKYKRR